MSRSSTAPAWIAHGSSTSAGGNQYLRGASALLTRSVILGGIAAWQGGGIAVHGGTLELVACVLSGNHSPAGPGLFAATAEVAIRASRLDDHE